MPAVSVQGVSKKYRIFPRERDRLFEALSFGRKKFGHDFWALKDVNLEVEPGTTMGILGRNGAGKSTLLSVIAGIVQPTGGTVEAKGRLIAVSAVGALGFNPESTGRENILLNGMIMGLERREILDHFDDIAAFAEIGEFMDQPVKHYSTGMRSRLGFAVAVNVKPDILLLDETLAAGDEAYKQAAMDKLYELRNSGTTTLFVSHSLDMVEDFCTAAVLLHEGRLLATGTPAEIIDEYQALTSSVRAQKRQRRAQDEQGAEQAAVPEENGKTLQAPAEAPAQAAAAAGAAAEASAKASDRSAKPRKNRQQTENGGPPGDDDGVPEGEEAPEEPVYREDPDFGRRVKRRRTGTGEARIQGVDLLDERFRPVDAVASGSTVTVRVYLKHLEAVKDSELVIAVRDQAGSEQDEDPTEGQFYGPNLGYVLDLYEEYRRDPESVDEGTREFFETWRPPRANGRAPAAARELFSASTALEGVGLEELGERVVVDFTFKVPVRKGRYGVSIGARAGDADSYLDRVEVATTLRIKRPRNRKPPRGALHLPTTIKVHTPEGRLGRPA